MGGSDHYHIIQGLWNKTELLLNYYYYYFTRFEPRYKIIRNEKNLNIDSFLTDVSALPYAAIYAVDCHNEKLDIFNQLFVSCLNDHVPLLRQKITRPPAPWLKDLNIAEKQREKNLLRATTQQSQNETDLAKYRLCRNEVKKLIKSAKSNFYRNALSSKRPKEVWNTIHRILRPNPV